MILLKFFSLSLSFTRLLKFLFCTSVLGNFLIKIFLQSFEFAALLACRLETGRTHQIRVHLTSIGHPVIGDPQYGKSPLKQLSGISTELSQTITNFKRQALHAEILGFEHPVSGEWLEFKAPFPDDYKILLKAIQHD